VSEGVQDQRRIGEAQAGDEPTEPLADRIRVSVVALRQLRKQPDVPCLLHALHEVQKA
jgi:hypothetical protein